MNIDFFKLSLTILGASGFWTLAQILFGYITNRRLKAAQTRNLNEQANHLVLKNWVEWSEKMESRIAELECKNREMTQTISRQRKLIEELQQYIGLLEEEIKSYRAPLDES